MAALSRLLYSSPPTNVPDSERLRNLSLDAPVSRSTSPHDPIPSTLTGDGSVSTVEATSGHDADDTDDAQEQCPPAYASYDQPLPQFYQMYSSPYYSTPSTYGYASSSTQYNSCPSHPPVPPFVQYQSPSMYQPSGPTIYNRFGQHPIPAPYGYGHGYDYIHARHTEQYGQEYPLFSHHPQQHMFPDAYDHYRPSGWSTCLSDNISPTWDTFSSSQSNSTKSLSISIKGAFKKFKVSLSTAVQALKFKSGSDECELLEHCTCFMDGHEEGYEDYRRPYATIPQDSAHMNAITDSEEEEDDQEASLYPTSMTRVRGKEICECRPCMKALAARIVKRSRGGRRKYRRIVSRQRRITSFKLSRLNALNH